MIQEERLTRILSIINENRFVTAEELKNILYVSLSTIRRDLAELNRRGLIVRSQGGAIAKSEIESTDAVAINADPLLKAKTAIAKRAAELVHDGDTIFLAFSSTVFLMISALQKKKNITVVTNSTKAVMLLSKMGITAYGCCGKVDDQRGYIYGNDAVEFISKFNFDASFFSCNVVSQLGDICIDSSMVAPIKASLLRAKNRICLCDASKFKKTVDNSQQNAFTAQNIDILITDDISYHSSFSQKALIVHS